MERGELLGKVSKKVGVTSEKSRNWLLTLNNPDVTLESLHVRAGAVYTCGQLEQGVQGTRHFQFFMNFKDPVRLASFKKLDVRIHAEIVFINNGAHTYCMKEDTRLEGPWEFGVKPVQRNNKTDWEEVMLKAKTGRIDEIPAEIYVQHYSNLKRIEKDHIVLHEFKHLRGIWIYGPAGFGKSRRARELYPDAYPKLCNKWWDGYQNQKHVIMDDVGLDHKCLGQQLKIWSDGYGVILENKGGAMASQYDWFVVTSQYSIEEIWEGDLQTIAALKRRFEVTKLVFPMYGLKLIEYPIGLMDIDK